MYKQDGIRVDYQCDMCGRHRQLFFVKLPDVEDVRKVITPPDWRWTEEALVCECCGKAEGGPHD